MMAFGLGPMIGAAFGGAVAGSLGVRSLFLITAIMLCAVTVVFFFLFRRQSKRDGMES